jgi:hypothetical protein
MNCFNIVVIFMSAIESNLFPEVLQTTYFVHSLVSPFSLLFLQGRDFFIIIISFSNQNRDNTFYKLIWWFLGEHSPVMSWWGLLQWRVLFLNSSDQLAIFFLISCCWKVALLSDVTVCWDDALFCDDVSGCWFWSLLWQRALSDRRVGKFKW